MIDSVELFTRMRISNMKKCIVVLGMHRSGTSVLTGLVSMFGAYVGSELMRPTKDNPKGYFENNKIYILNERILRENDASWDSYSFVVEDVNSDKFKIYVSEAKAIIKEELKYVKTTIIKDPRLCLLFPVWEQALKELGIEIKIIFVYRSPLEVTQSLQKRDDIAIEKGLMLWSHYFLQSEFYSRKYERLIVEYDRDFLDLSAFLEKISDFIGIKVTDEILKKAKEFYSPSLKHHQVKFDNISDDLPSYLLKLIALLSNKKFNKLRQLDNIRNEFNYSKSFYLFNESSQSQRLGDLQQEVKDAKQKLKDIKQKDITAKEKMLLEFSTKQKDFQRQLNEQKKKYNLKINELDSKKNEFIKISEVLANKSRVLSAREKDLSSARDEQYLMKKRLELLESRLIVGDEFFQDIINSKVVYQRLRRQTEKLFATKARKLLLFPFLKKSKKSIIRDKSVIQDSGLFSIFYYLSRYPDVWQAKVDPLDHFCRLGWKEGRNPSASFNVEGYLEMYPDVSRSKINPLVHYIIYGRDEGRVLPKSSYSLLSSNLKTATTVTHKVNKKAKYKAFDGKQKFIMDQNTILLIAHSAGDVIYGGERSFFDMVEAASRSTFNVIVILPRKQQEIIDRLELFATKILIFKYGWWKKDQSVSEKSIETFANIMIEYEVSIVHVNTIMLREPLLAAKQLDIRSVIHIRELITGDQALASIIGKEIGEITSIVAKASNYIIANSQATATAYNATDKTTVIHNTVDVDLFDIDNPLGDVLKVGLISSNIEKKGVFEFLQIAEKCQDIRNLVFVLIGPETTEIKEIRVSAEKKSLTNLVFAGYKDTSLEAISEANIILNISKFTESFGRTVLEGMAARRPVIGYRWGALKELIIDNETGYLVPYMDTDLVAEKLKFLSSNRDMIENMGERARERAVNNFSFNAYAEKVQTFYHRILQSSQITNLHKKESKLQRIAYFLWHFPVPSETFVLNELRVLINNGYDVIVFCKQSPFPEFSPDFKIKWERVASPKELAKKLKKTKRTIVHSHFTYPTVTNMVWPACEIAKVDFTFIAHAQDIFRYENIERNKIAEISKSKYCRNVFIPSRYHREYVIEQGVVPEKTLINPNGIDPDLYAQNRERTEVREFNYSVCAIHRYTEKKGLDALILSGLLLENTQVEIHIYGYGDLEENYLSLIKENNINNVTIHGAVKGREEMLSIFSENDAFLCPSVRAEDGDMDGIPTVLMEAMAYGLPVISTDLSGIPDLLTHKLTGFIIESTPQSVANTINELYQTPPQQLASISKAAKAVIYKNYNSISLVNNLVRAWSDSNSLDIVIVSWNNLPELKEVIKRIHKYTLTDYNLIICDNNSEADVRDFLEELQSNANSKTSNRKKVKVFFNPDNSMVGPGTNIAMDLGSAEYIIYVCGKEGFVFDYMWEQTFINYMDENPAVGLGGTLCYSPTYLTGGKYPKGVKLFDQFRNKQFATNNPDRIFKHVQGGFFVIRREMVDQIGGFSDEVNHSYTDVEYSYYAESCGWRLGHIQGMLSLYNKSRPTLFSRFDESIRAIHPPTLEQLPLLDQVNKREIAFCNICEWQGDGFNNDGLCPSCNSQPDDRTLYRYLAESTLTYRRLAAVAVALPKVVDNFWNKQFQGESLSFKSFSKKLKKNGKLQFSQAGLQLFYYKNTQHKLDESLLKEGSRVLKDGGVFLIQQQDTVETISDTPLKLSTVIEQLGNFDFEFEEEISYSSAVVQYGWNQFWVFKKNAGQAQ